MQRPRFYFSAPHHPDHVPYAIKGTNVCMYVHITPHFASWWRIPPNTYALLHPRVYLDDFCDGALELIQFQLQFQPTFLLWHPRYVLKRREKFWLPCVPFEVYDSS